MEIKILASIVLVLVAYEWTGALAQADNEEWEGKVAKNRIWEIPLERQKKGNL